MSRKSNSKKSIPFTNKSIPRKSASRKSSRKFTPRKSEPRKSGIKLMKSPPKLPPKEVPLRDFISKESLYKEFGSKELPQKRSPQKRSPPKRSPPKRSPLKRSPLKRSPLKRSPLKRSPPKSQPKKTQSRITSSEKESATKISRTKLTAKETRKLKESATSKEKLHTSLKKKSEQNLYDFVKSIKKSDKSIRSDLKIGEGKASLYQNLVKREVKIPEIKSQISKTTKESVPQTQKVKLPKLMPKKSEQEAEQKQKDLVTSYIKSDTRRKSVSIVKKSTPKSRESAPKLLTKKSKQEIIDYVKNLEKTQIKKKSSSSIEEGTAIQKKLDSLDVTQVKPEVNKSPNERKSASRRRRRSKSKTKEEAKRPVTPTITLAVRKGIWYEEIAQLKHEKKVAPKQLPVEIQNKLKKKGYEIKNYIFDGSFSNVWRMTKNEKHSYAVKAYNSNELDDRMKFKLVPREAGIWKKIKHKYIIRLRHLVGFNNYLFLILEMGTTDLQRDLSLNGCVAENDARAWTHQIVSGLSYLHSKFIAHRGVKLENIIIVDNTRVKLGDFGLATYSHHPQTNEPILDTDICGSYHYLAPETLNRIPHDPRKSDIWALGVVVFAMVTWTMPFGKETDLTPDGLRKLADLQKVQTFSYPSSIPISFGLKDFIKQMFIYAFEDRPDIESIKSQRWLA